MFRPSKVRAPVRRHRLQPLNLHQLAGKYRQRQAYLSFELDGALYWLEYDRDVDVAYEIERLLPR